METFFSCNNFDYVMKFDRDLAADVGTIDDTMVFRLSFSSDAVQTNKVIMN